MIYFILRVIILDVVTEIYNEPKAEATRDWYTPRDEGQFIHSIGPVDATQQENYLANIRFNIAVIEMAEKFPQLLPHLKDLLVDPRG